ncbi:MAG: asparagine synthase (glutamine-hydrolyzing) [Phycisphaeraceae bacterium]|nr:asparagine synthase (glutamine-hydrolyzing) [Phycisphaeraceae bacterium]MCW5768838.1 asparagine synthase (glutamine-hydrolyzing) [Phycisphaeraceae bacterium]
MCGIIGIARGAGAPVTLSDAQVVAMRDRMIHRGPDDAGMVRLGSVVLAHRRLSVIDPTPAGHQPMSFADRGGSESGWLVYNGEIYNDAELRGDLSREGVAFATSCDTETLGRCCEQWGPAVAAARVRGMFAFAWYDPRAGALTLARDPIGIKPLYYTMLSVAGISELVFASEIGAILAHPGVRAVPDPVTVSAYLTTIRTTLGPRTLYEGIRVVRPGQVLTFDLRTASLPAAHAAIDTSRWSANADRETDATERVIRESVRVHLRADVPTCALLSGGLDSSIVVSAARWDVGVLRTYCSGAPEDEGACGSEDFAFARLVASRLGVVHTEAPVTRRMFKERWPAMVARMRMPMGTPNEVAINEVARTLRADGHVVALSGEGADEFFAGYDTPLSMALFHVEEGDLDPGVFQLNAAAWITLKAKPSLLNPGWWSSAERDEELVASYRSEFVAVSDEAASDAESRGRTLDPLERHIRFQQRINLVGLLQRLDSATMLESVEGRTPLADVVVRAHAWSLPMARKFTETRTATGVSPLTRTKIALREAFADALPPEIVERKKASFPLPFQAWVSDQSESIRRSAFLREIFTDAAILTVAERPTELWSLAWPMANLAIWGETM